MDNFKYSQNQDECMLIWVITYNLIPPKKKEKKKRKEKRSHGMTTVLKFNIQKFMISVAQILIKLKII